MDGSKLERFFIKLVMFLSVAIPAIILVVYFSVFEGWKGAETISDNPGDWASFGSVLAGAFTLLGSMSTALALYFVSQQHKVARDVARRQVESMTLEQYIGHRKIFGERLDTLTKKLKEEISFSSHDDLYMRFFRRNSPVHVEMLVPISKTESGELYNLFRLYKDLHEKAMEIQKYRRVEVARDFVVTLLNLQIKLGFTVQGVNGYGAVRCAARKDLDLQLNIFSLMNSLRRAEVVLNSYLFFTGNKEVNEFNFKKIYGIEELPLWVMLGLCDERHRKGLSVELDGEKKILRLLDVYRFCVVGGSRASLEDSSLKVSYIYEEAVSFLRDLMFGPAKVGSNLKDDGYTCLVEKLEILVSAGADREFNTREEGAENDRRKELDDLLKALRKKMPRPKGLFD
ncbi:hypothetical protein P6Q65_004940 [Pseudomonas aeruginosa]|nr:hypothetical protein [Pseudomonas aeruginosa]EKQ7207021.1 hypothetical protein [Pseudomonas aeruginosa]ELO0921065.1 hypothetical protein [Pseudomonas aeruginosa]